MKIEGLKFFTRKEKKVDKFLKEKDKRNLNSNRENVVIKKINSCDDKYPRDYDKIIKKPLVKKQ